jgi:hypothetical protein
VAIESYTFSGAADELSTRNKKLLNWWLAEIFPRGERSFP